MARSAGQVSPGQGRARGKVIAAGQAELTLLFLRHLHTLPETLDLPLWRVEQLLEAAIGIEKIEQANIEVALRQILRSL